MQYKEWYDLIQIEDVIETLEGHSWDRIRRIDPDTYEKAEEAGKIQGEGRVWGKRGLGSIDKVVVHQTAGEGRLEAFNKYHTGPNHISIYGLPKLAYHFYIPYERDRFTGQSLVYKVNALDDLTYHCKGANRTAIGVVVEGALHSPYWRGGRRHPTDMQMNALRGIWLYLKETFKWDTGRHLYSHSHFGKPACPGEVVEKWVRSMRMGTVYSFNTIGEVQRVLQELGFYDGDIDGMYGPITRRAVALFENRYKEYGLTPDGYWDDVTADMLQKVWNGHVTGESVVENINEKG